jgi:hypothetical protein
VHSRAPSGYNFSIVFYRLFCVNSMKKQKIIQKEAIFAICILHLLTYLEALNSHFQPNRHLKIFKNSGTDLIAAPAKVT